MNNKVLTELGIDDCFVDAKKIIDVDNIKLNNLRKEIRNKIVKNEQMHNKGLELLLLEEKYISGEISQNSYQKVKKII